MLKFTNNTNNKIWIGNYCFVPGVSTIEEITAKELIPMLKSLEHKDWKEAIKGNVISYEIDKNTLKEIEDIKNSEKEKDKEKEEKTK
ncbi:MAG: hypothetical protein ACRCXQ_09580 [Vagococcus fluvialis]